MQKMVFLSKGGKTTKGGFSPGGDNLEENW